MPLIIFVFFTAHRNFKAKISSFWRFLTVCWCAVSFGVYLMSHQRRCIIFSYYIPAEKQNELCKNPAVLDIFIEGFVLTLSLCSTKRAYRLVSAHFEYVFFNQYRSEQKMKKTRMKREKTVKNLTKTKRSSIYFHIFIGERRPPAPTWTDEKSKRLQQASKTIIMNIPIVSCPRLLPFSVCMPRRC